MAEGASEPGGGGPMLDGVLARLQDEGRVGLMTHIVYGYPTVEESRRIVEVMVRSGVDIIAESEALENEKVRVVSMPCTAVFDSQPQAYRDSVLPPGVSARIAVEAAVTAGWYKYVGMDGIVIGIDTFGESAPARELFAYFGFTVDKVVEAVISLLSTD